MFHRCVTPLNHRYYTVKGQNYVDVGLILSHCGAFDFFLFGVKLFRRQRGDCAVIQLVPSLWAQTKGSQQLLNRTCFPQDEDEMGHPTEGNLLRLV